MRLSTWELWNWRMCFSCEVTAGLRTLHPKSGTSPCRPKRRKKMPDPRLRHRLLTAQPSSRCCGHIHLLKVVIWNMYNIMYEMSRQSRFDAGYWMLGAGALGQPRGRVWGGRREEGSGWGARVYLWRIHFDVWQNYYSVSGLKIK